LLEVLVLAQEEQEGLEEGLEEEEERPTEQRLPGMLVQEERHFEAW
jgi:hypothetical protein